MCVIRGRDGFTLVEFLAAVVIMLVGLLGLLQTVNYSISTNMVNLLRNEAVAVADQELTQQIAKGFTNISTLSPGQSPMKYSIYRKVLGAFKNYSVSRSGDALSNSKKVNITVRWRYKNTLYTHDASAVVSP